MTQDALAGVTQLSKRSIVRYEKDETAPSADALRTLAKVTGVAYAWLKRGEGEMLAGQAEPQREVEQAAVQDGPVRTIPVAPMGHGAGSGVINDGAGLVVQMPEAVIQRFTGGRIPGRLAISFVRGDSMLPYLPDGTPIIIEEMGAFAEGGRYAIYYGNTEEEEVKRVERLGEKRIRISSDNRAFPPRLYEHIEGDLFADLSDGHHERIRIRGRIIHPLDMAAAVTGQLAEFAGNLLSILQR